MIRKVEGQWWRYWVHGDERPEPIPDKMVRVIPSLGFSENMYRWPIPEHEALTELYCQLHGISVPDGWEAVGFGDVAGNRYLTVRGLQFDATRYSVGEKHNAPILRRKEPEFEWVTPTDDDAKGRPEVEVCYTSEPVWHGGYKLISVVESNAGNAMYFVHNYDIKRDYGNCVGFCRMKRYKQ